MTGLSLPRFPPVIRSRYFPVSPAPALVCLLCDTYTDITPKMMQDAVRRQKKQARTVLIGCACFLILWLVRLGLLHLLTDFIDNPVPEVVRLGESLT